MPSALSVLGTFLATSLSSKPAAVIIRDGQVTLEQGNHTVYTAQEGACSLRGGSQPVPSLPRASLPGAPGKAMWDTRFAALNLLDTRGAGPSEV